MSQKSNHRVPLKDVSIITGAIPDAQPRGGHMAEVNPRINARSRWKIGSVGRWRGRIWNELNSLLERLETLVAILSFKWPFND